MFGKATLRGGQTLLHDVHMWGQLVRWEILGLVLTIVLVPAVALSPLHDRPMNGASLPSGTLAEAKLALGYARDSGQAYEWREGRKTATRIVDIAADPRIERIRQTPARYRLRQGVAGSSG